MLARPKLEQLAQRVIARYHLAALSLPETAGYIRHRLSVAGLTSAPPFRRQLIKTIHQLTKGVPRRINLLCDRALLGAYAENKHEVDQCIINKAAREVFAIIPAQRLPQQPRRYATLVGMLLIGAAIATGIGAWSLQQRATSTPANLTSDATRSAVRQSDTQSVPSVRQVANNPVTEAPAAADDARDAAAAYRALARLWNVSLDGDDPCRNAPAHDLHCYTSTSGFAELRQLDRPAVMTLRDDAGHPYYAVLIELTNTTASVRIGGKLQIVSVVALARQSSGEFMTFWRAPQRYRGHIDYGDRGPEVNWIATQLAKLEEKDAPPEHPFNQQMAKQVRDFQYAQGLKVDGLVGPRTIMQLNRAAGVDEPRLQRTAAVAESGVK